MRIGCNWSAALKQLLEQGKVHVDYIKTGVHGNFHEQFVYMRALRPVLLHGLGYFENAGMANSDIIDFDSANRIITQCNSPHYGIHLAIRKSDMFSGMTDEDIYKRMCKQVQLFKRNLSVPLLLENPPDTPTDRTVFDHYPYRLPEQISRIICDNDVSFLLDITHAKLTSKFNGFDIHEYLEALPLDRVAEIHTNGSGYDLDGLPKDTHQAMEEEDFALLEWVLQHSNPDIITLEFNEVETDDYDPVLQSVETQLNRIQKLRIQYSK